MGARVTKQKANQTSTKDTIDNIQENKNSFPKNGYPVTQKRLEPIARVLLIAVYDDDNPLSIFRGMRYIIKEIWELAIQFNRHYYSPYIEIKDDPFGYGFIPHREFGTTTAFELIDNDAVGHDSPLYVAWHQLEFPEPLEEEVNINMMPILMDPKKLESQLPLALNGYIPWIRACLAADPSQKGKICFVTIHESFVEKGKTQRRPGLHVELPGIGIGGDTNWRGPYWGGGFNRKDGIFISSNTSDTCAVWNCRIIERDDVNGGDIIPMDKLGGLEHLRCVIPNKQRYSLDGGKLYWITDRTPHEVLPMKQDGWRQFFRLVSSKLGVWYKDHSAMNPKGIVPNPKITKVIKGNKFKMK